MCGSVVGSSLLLDRVGILFFNGVGEEKGSLGTSRANHFIQHTGREDDGGEHKAGLGGEEPLPQHRQADGDAGLGDQCQAQVIADVGRVTADPAAPA